MPYNITQAEPLKNFISTLGAEGDELIIDHVVDITDICDRATLPFAQVVLNYFRLEDPEAALVQIEFRERVDEKSSNTTKFGISTDPESTEFLVTDPGFHMRANLCGCEAVELAGVMVENMPTDDYPLAA